MLAGKALFSLSVSSDPCFSGPWLPHRVSTYADPPLTLQRMIMNQFHDFMHLLWQIPPNSLVLLAAWMQWSMHMWLDIVRISIMIAWPAITACR